MRLYAQLAQIFRTPISDLRRMPHWEIQELVNLANEQARKRR